MKKLFSLLLLIVASSLYSQNSINGTVIDEDTKKAIAFTTIYFPQLEKGTTASANGTYSIKNIPNGTYKVLFSIVGYETLSKEITISIKTELNIALSPSAIEIEEIIISTPFHKLQSENVMKVERLKVSELKQEGALTLANGLQNIAGVENISTGIGIGKPVIRGLSSNRVLVYTQGVRLENQQFGDEHGLGVDGNGIESVEVIKGPASLLYGSDALGGVLYLNPERFAMQNESKAQGSFSYFNNTVGVNTSLGYKSSGEAFKFLFRGSFTEHADYKTKDYRVTNSRFKTFDFKAGLGYQINAFKTEFRYNVNASKLGIPEEIGEQSTNRRPLLPFQQIDNHVFSSKSTLFLKKSSIEVNLGYIYNNRNEFEDHHHEDEHEDEEHDDEHEDEEEHDENETLSPALQMKLKTFNYDIKYHLPDFGKFETIVGTQGMHQTNTNYGEELLIPDATINDFGLFATSHIHFKTIDIQLGARYDNRIIGSKNINNSYNSFNGAVGFKTNLTKYIVGRLNFASGFRAPNLAELTSNGTHEGTNRYEIGDLNLNNEQNFQADLAIEFKNDHVEVFTNVFYNTITDYIFLSPNGELIDDDPVFIYEQNNAHLYGGEFGLHFHPHPLDWLHIENSFEMVIGKKKTGEYLPLIPSNKLNNIVRVEINSETFNTLNTFAKLSTAFRQNKVSDFETKTTSYSLFSLGVSGAFNLFKNEISFSASVTNLFDKEYTNHLSRLKSDNIYDIGRNISFNLTYNL